MSTFEDTGESRPHYPLISEDLIIGIGFSGVKMLDIKAAQHNWQIEQELGAIEAARREGLDPQAADARELAVLRRLRESVYEHGMRIPLNELHRASQAAGEPPVPVPRPNAPYTDLHHPIQ